jgi:hypothetical protein
MTNDIYIIFFKSPDEKKKIIYASEILIKNRHLINYFYPEEKVRKNAEIEKIDYIILEQTGELIENQLIYERFRLNPFIPFNERRYSRLDYYNGKIESPEYRKKREKNEFFSRYRYKLIINLFKDKFFNHFNNECFKCKSKDNLVIDHNIPSALGGHYVEGNLVSLCRKCNSRKWNNHPEYFYSEKETLSLQNLLNNQKSLFEFEFNQYFFENDRLGYLLSLGLQKDLIEKAFNDPLSDLFHENFNHNLNIILKLKKTDA